MRSCGTCRFWFDDDDINGKESEYGDCEGPIPSSVYSPILNKMHRTRDGRECRCWQSTLSISATQIHSFIGEKITIKKVFDVVSFQSLVSVSETTENLQRIEDDLGKIGRIGLAGEIEEVKDKLVKIALDIKAKINPSVFKR